MRFKSCAISWFDQTRGASASGLTGSGVVVGAAALGGAVAAFAERCVGREGGLFDLTLGLFARAILNLAFYLQVSTCRFSPKSKAFALRDAAIRSIAASRSTNALG